PMPLVVHVSDLFGNVASGAGITWTSAAGTVSDGATTADAQGNSSITFTLGPSAGAQQVTATSAAVPSVSTSFTASALVVKSVKIVAGDNQDATDGALLGNMVVAKALDPNDVPVPGVTLTWGLVYGSGRINENPIGSFVQTVTDASGSSPVQYRYG